MRRSVLGLTMALLVGGLAALEGAHDAAASDELVFSEAVIQQSLGLEGRLRAPCCWKQTLDIHHSPLADQVRNEIRKRLTAGESVGVIESDLVRRYGDRIQALPSEGFMTPIAIVLMGLVGVALLGFLFVGRRMTEQPAEARAPAAAGADEAALREQLSELD